MLWRELAERTTPWVSDAAASAEGGVRWADSPCAAQILPSRGGCVRGLLRPRELYTAGMAQWWSLGLPQRQEQWCPVDCYWDKTGGHWITAGPGWAATGLPQGGMVAAGPAVGAVLCGPVLPPPPAPGSASVSLQPQSAASRVKTVLCCDV